MKSKNPQLDLSYYIDQSSYYYGITNKFSLYCEYQSFKYKIYQFQGVVEIAGVLFFGYLADNKGRKSTLKSCWKVFTVGMIIYSLVDELALFIFGYYMASFAYLSIMNI